MKQQNTKRRSLFCYIYIFICNVRKIVCMRLILNALSFEKNISKMAWVNERDAYFWSKMQCFEEEEEIFFFIIYYLWKCRPLRWSVHRVSDSMASHDTCYQTKIVRIQYQRNKNNGFVFARKNNNNNKITWSNVVLVGILWANLRNKSAFVCVWAFVRVFASLFSSVSLHDDD